MQALVVVLGKRQSLLEQCDRAVVVVFLLQQLAFDVQRSEVVGVGSKPFVENLDGLGVLVELRIGDGKEAEDVVVVGILTIHILKFGCIGYRVFLRLELCGHHCKLDAQSILGLLGILHGIFYILLSVFPVLGLVSVDSSIVCNVGEVSILRLVELGKHRIGSGVNIGGKELVSLVVVFLLLVVDTTVDELSAQSVEAVGVL